MPDFDVNLGAESAKYKKNSKKINKNLNDLRLLFLELVHLGLCSGKVWENWFFLYCMTLVDPYSKLLLSGEVHANNSVIKPNSKKRSLEQRFVASTYTP